MAKGRIAPVMSLTTGRKLPAPKPGGSRAVTLSISLSLLLIAPLWLQGCSDDAPARRSNSLDSSAKTSRVVPLPAPPFQNESLTQPISGEVLLRLNEITAQKLHLALVEANRPFGQAFLPHASLIGARLPAEYAWEVLPEFRSLFSHYHLWAADAIDPEQGLWRLKLSDEINPLAAATAFGAQPGVAYAEPNYPIQAFAREPSDPFFTPNQAALRRIGAPDAWDITTGSDKITIAILDTGLAYGHSELRNKIAEGGRNFVAQPANEFAWDDHGHGTFMAGIAAAESDNRDGIAGVAWGAKVLSVKVLDYNQYGTIATLAMGLSYVATQPVQIVNISAGGAIRSRTLEETAQKAFDRGLVLLAATGNSNKQEFNYPAAFDSVIAVGAVDELDRPADFATYGQYLSLVAPGTAITSLSWASEREYAITSGTSTACPFVAGTVALMLSINPSLTNRQIRGMLEATADVVPGTPPALNGINPTVRGTSSIAASASPTAAATPTATYLPVTVPAVGSTTTPGAISASTVNSGYNVRTGWGRLNAYQAVLAARNGTTFLNRQATFSGQLTGLPDPLDATVTLDPGDTRYPAKDGSFQFDHLPPGSYKVTIESKKYNLQATYSFQVQGRSAETFSFKHDFGDELAQISGATESVGAFRSLSQPPGGQSVQFFPETGHSLSGAFKQYWENRGGIIIFGRPISEEFQENGKTVQYFERAVLEYQTEFARTRAEVQPRLLGSLLMKDSQDSAFKRLAEPGKPLSNAPTRPYFDQTGHTLSGPFLIFWETNGGVNVFGYPISEPYEVSENGGPPRLVQYFERSRMDYFPEFNNTPYYIQLALLARDLAYSKGLLRK